MTTIILDTIARQLDALPLNEAQRADIYHAWDSAPDQPIDATDFEAWDDYFHGAAGRAWRRVRDIKIHRTDGADYYATTLGEMSYGESAPTKTEILKALSRAAFQMNGELT